MELNILHVGMIHGALIVMSLCTVRCIATHWATKFTKLLLILITVPFGSLRLLN